MSTTWSVPSATTTHWGKITQRWLLGEQPSYYPEHADERLLLGDNDRLGGHDDALPHTTWS